MRKQHKCLLYICCYDVRRTVCDGFTVTFAGATLLYGLECLSLWYLVHDNVLTKSHACSGCCGSRGSIIDSIVPPFDSYLVLSKEQDALL